MDDRRILAINIIFDPDPGLLEWLEFLSIRTMALNLYFGLQHPNHSVFITIISDDFTLSESEIVAAKDGIGKK